MTNGPSPDGEVVYDTKHNFPAPQLPFRLANRLPVLVAIPWVRRRLLKRLVNAKSCMITPGFYCILGDNIFADSVYLNDTVILDYAPVRIGSGTMFSGANKIITSTHKLEDFSIVTARPVTIGRNVWITHGCIILGGVTIGDNSVIGAGAVVTSSIPANVLAAGNPCRVIKQIDRQAA